MGSYSSRIRAEREFAYLLAFRISKNETTAERVWNSTIPLGTRKLLFEDTGKYIGYKLLCRCNYSS
jgi:hypothetical protein